MHHIHHKIVRSFLDKQQSKFSLDDIASARAKFEKASKSIFKLPIKYVKDIHINSNLSIRIYKKHLDDKVNPTVIYFHGGGFVLGSTDSHDDVCRYICKYSGATVISVNYRLAPEFVYPNPIIDGDTVLQWVKINHLKEQLDVSNTYLAGDSAGGQIALELAVQAKYRLKGLILIYPTLGPNIDTPSKRKYSKGHFLTLNLLEEFWQIYLNGQQYADLEDKMLINLPNTLIIGAEKDILRDEGANLATRLQAINVPVDYKCYSNMLHGFMQYPRIAGDKTQAFKKIAQFIRSNTTS